MKKLCVLGLLLIAVVSAAASPTDEDWIALFNGKDLSGWSAKITRHHLGDNYAQTFRVENGVLKISYDQYERFDGRFGVLFYEQPFGYYRLRIEYRFVGEQAPHGPGAWAMRNSGVMLHSQPPQTMQLNQDFPISIEAQLLGGLSDGKARPTMNVCTPGMHVVYEGRIHPDHCLNSQASTIDGDEWVSAEILVLGAATVTHYVNGKNVLEYALPQIGGGEVNHHDPAAKPDGKLVERGYIALQSESHPLEFRKVELLNLEGCMDRTAKNYKAYHVKSQPDACRY